MIEIPLITLFIVLILSLPKRELKITYTDLFSHSLIEILREPFIDGYLPVIHSFSIYLCTYYIGNYNQVHRAHCVDLFVRLAKKYWP